MSSIPYYLNDNVNIGQEKRIGNHKFERLSIKKEVF